MSISRTVEVTEPVDSGRRDSDGHTVYIPTPVKNSLGETVYRTEYLIPPSVRGLCDYLGIDKSTWALYSDHKRHPELAHITDDVHERLKAWNEEELLTRPGKDLKGIIFNLECNYGYREPAEAAGAEGVEDYLRRLGEAGGDVWL